MRADVNVGVQGTYAIRCEFGLEFAYVRKCIHCLAMEIRRFQPVAVDEAEPANAGAGQIADDRDAQTAAADDEYAARTKFRLAGGANFLQCHLP